MGYLMQLIHSLQSGCWALKLDCLGSNGALPLNSCVPSGKFSHLPNLQFPLVSNGYNNCTYLVGLL